MGSTFSGSRLEGLPHSSQYQTIRSKYLFWYWNEVPCLGRDGFADDGEVSWLRGGTIQSRRRVWGRQGFDDSLHLSKLALLTQGGTVPDVEAALERHCSQLVDLVRIPFVTIWWEKDPHLKIFWWEKDPQTLMSLLSHSTPQTPLPTLVSQNKAIFLRSHTFNNKNYN